MRDSVSEISSSMHNDTAKKEGYNRKDLMKVLHYAIIALYVHDLEQE